jgi:hypothetical protein
MQTNEVFQKLTSACETVLKSQGGSGIEVKKMTADEFAAYAVDQIAKAEAEKATPSVATARIRALNTSIAVAKGAFQTAGLSSFEIPLFNEKSIIAMKDIETRFKGIEQQVKSLADSLDKKGKPFGDEDEDKDAEKAKGKADEDEDEKDAEKAKGKADEDEDEKDATEKAEWPMDLAKAESRSKDEKALYDWGSDPA